MAIWKSRKSDLLHAMKMGGNDGKSINFKSIFHRETKTNWTTNALTVPKNRQV